MYSALKKTYFLCFWMDLVDMVNPSPSWQFGGLPPANIFLEFEEHPQNRLPDRGHDLVVEH